MNTNIGNGDYCSCQVVFMKQSKLSGAALCGSIFFFALGFIRPADDETALVIVSEHIICSLFSSTSPTYTGQEAHIARKTVTPGTS